MFSALRQNSIFYILDKNNTPTIQEAKVVSVSSPQYYNTLNPTVDVSVSVGSETMEFKALPANLNIADSGKTGIVVSENREAMITEVEAMLRTSQQVIDTIDYHHNVVNSCDSILKKLDPRFAKDKEQEAKINTLENKVVNIEQGISDMKAMMSQLLTKRQGD